MITKKWIEIGGGKSMEFSANGVSFIGITDLTGEDKIEHFYKLCLELDDYLCKLTAQVKKDREWNIANPGKGKRWPSMRELERTRKQLCHQANISDS